MEQIGQQKIWSYFDDSAEASPAANHVIRGGRGHCVRTYVELATKVAKLQFPQSGTRPVWRQANVDHVGVVKEETLSCQGRRPPMAKVEWKAT